jgi:hypothetical protein
MIIILTCSWELGWIAKGASQLDKAEGILRAPQAATLRLLTQFDHEAQLRPRWKGLLGANPNPPCWHSMWEETEYPKKKIPRFSVELRRGRFFSHECHKSVARIEPTIS